MVQYSQKRLPRYRPFDFAESGPKQIKSYPAGGATTCDFTEINLRIKDVPKNDSECSDPKREVDGVRITMSPGGFGCCLDPLVVTVPYCEATNPECFGEALLCALAREPRIGGFGRFEWDADKLSLKFYARTPGFEVDFSVDSDCRYVEYCVRTRGTQSAAGLRPGQLVVHAPSHVMQGDKFGHVFAPTTDLNSEDSDECYAGIVIACPTGTGEQAPIGYSTNFPIASNCDSQCAPPPTCLRVLKWGPPIWYPLMDTWCEGSCKLYYNYCPDENNPDTGMLYANPGEGRAELPMNYSIEGMEDGGRVLQIRFSM